MARAAGAQGAASPGVCASAAELAPAGRDSPEGQEPRRLLHSRGSENELSQPTPPAAVALGEPRPQTAARCGLPQLWQELQPRKRPPPGAARTRGNCQHLRGLIQRSEPTGGSVTRLGGAPTQEAPSGTPRGRR